MPVRHPIEYEARPTEIERGRSAVIVSLRNVGAHDLTQLEVRLNSLDQYAIDVLQPTISLPVFTRRDERELSFDITAHRSGRVYITIDGFEDGVPFHWESAGIQLGVASEVAELASLLVMSPAATTAGKALRVEATIRALARAEGVRLEFWTFRPDGKFISLGSIDAKPMVRDEEVRYSTEFTPWLVGSYEVHAYLGHTLHRIGHLVEQVQVREAERRPDVADTEAVETVS